MGKSTTRYLQWTFAALVLTIVVGYNGCGETGFNSVYMSDLASISGVKSQCDAQLMQVYSTTYFPLLSTNCNRCHSDAHGSTDLATSFQAFMQKGQSLIDYQATHPHGDNGVNLTTQIAAVQAPWAAGQANYATCLASNPDPGGGSGSTSDVRTLDKVIPGIDATLTQNGTFKTISWDVSTEVFNANQKGLLNAVLTLDVRYALQGTVAVGLEFKNPRMHLKAAGATIEVTGLNLYLDKVLQDRVTIYSTIDAMVNSTTDIILAPGFANSLVYYPQVTANTLVSFDIELADGTAVSTTTTTLPPGVTTTTTLPKVVTFTQLISNDATLGVFKKSCLGCHSGTSAADGVDLSDYATAKKNASTIQTRMQNAANPMPPQGILGTADRSTVNLWITGGTPQ